MVEKEAVSSTYMPTATPTDFNRVRISHTNEYDYISSTNHPMEKVDEAIEPIIEHDKPASLPVANQTFQLGRNNSAIPTKTKSDRRLFLADFAGNCDINTNPLLTKKSTTGFATAATKYRPPRR